MANTPHRSGTNNTLIICATVVIVFVVAGVVMISWAVPDNDAALSRIAILVGILAPTLGILANLVKTDKVQEATEQVDAKVDSILNGAGQAKIEQAVHTVLEARGVGETPPGT